MSSSALDILIAILVQRKSTACFALRLHLVTNDGNSSHRLSGLCSSPEILPAVVIEPIILV